jgi:hypothetical protein
MAKLPSEEIQQLLRTVVDHFDKEDVSIRERQIRTWRQLKLLWDGYSRTWFSEVAHDWRIDDAQSNGDSDQASYDKPINVFRAYLESIIAALSVTVPPIKCYPDDADNTMDLATARAGDKIAQLIYRHNDVPLLWLHALFIYMTEGMVACYSYPRSDDKYGTYEDKKYSDEEEHHSTATCPSCGYQIADDVNAPPDPNAPPVDPTQPVPTVGPPQVDPQQQALTDKLELSEDEFMPDDVQVQDVAQGDMELCPACMQLIAPVLAQETLIVTKLVGVTKEPKSRMCLEAYGGLYVKVPNYARKQEDCLYLIYAYETHFANVIQRHEHLQKADFQEKIKASTGPKDPYEEWGRLNPQYQGEYPQNLVTCRNAWLRPAAFNILQPEEAKLLREKYPNGCKVVLANDVFAEACDEALDDYWTLTHNPMSDFIHHDPLGLLLVSIQEITNDLISLVLQTIEHGIGQTFADPGVLNFNAYRGMESIPGGIYEATPKSGKSIGDAFHEVKTASLSPEVMPFGSQIQSLGQLVSGALPSLFGGAVEGSGTASEYSMSRAQALQRQQNTWKMLISWWKNIHGKAIPMFIKEIQARDDERDVQRDKNGNFFNVFIRKAELEGKLGKIELEANENLPLTWSQVKDVIMKLLEAQNPEILAILGAPENLPVIRDAIGLTDFFIPGEDDREKIYDDIKALLNSEPLQTGDPMMPEMPSVEVDPIFDDPEIGFELVRKWIISDAGRQAKTDNEAGYRNVLLYGKSYYQLKQQQMMTQPPVGADGKPVKEDQSAPITGEPNASKSAVQ